MTEEELRKMFPHKVTRDCGHVFQMHFTCSPVMALEFLRFPCPNCGIQARKANNQ